jgi:hypothetical protein
MINSAMLFVSMTFGQFEPVYICPPTVYVAPTDYIYYELDGMVERSRRYEWIEYGERNPIERRVPVINGYVPDVSKCRLDTGGWRIVYDYSRRTRLSDCIDCEKEYPKSKTSVPKPKKIIAPEPYESEPVKRKAPTLELKAPSQVFAN